MTSTPVVHQVVARLSSGDAIGHEALGIRRALRAAGYESEIVAEGASADLQDDAIDYLDFVDRAKPDDLLIHHFSLGSHALRAAYALPCRMMLVYHNITPYEYFLGIHDRLAQQCYQGRRELAAYRSRVDLAVGASEYSRRELEGLGFAPTAVLPVVPDFSHLEVAPDPRILAEFDDGWANILYVGRVVPHKRPDDLIRFFHAYQTGYNRKARLLVAGSSQEFEAYLEQLRLLTGRLRARDVHFLGRVTDAQLAALYGVADLYVSASAHEGFCVPIMESFYKRVPVLAFAATAVPETMGGGGVLFESREPALVAGLMHGILDDANLEAEVLRRQDEALGRLRVQDFDGRVVDLVRRTLAGPRRPAVTPAADFVAQLHLSRRLEEIRETRPSAFHALPYAPVPTAGNRR